MTAKTLLNYGGGGSIIIIIYTSMVLVSNSLSSRLVRHDEAGNVTCGLVVVHEVGNSVQASEGQS